MSVDLLEHQKPELEKKTKTPRNPRNHQKAPKAPKNS